MHKHPTLTRRQALALATLPAALSPFAVGNAHAELKDEGDPATSPRWLKVRAGLFGDRPISTEADAVISLDAPKRAEDAAIVPIAIRARFEQKPERFIRKVWLVIDDNPSPIAAIFSYTLDSGRADIETRVRVDEYSHVRAIAETDDGRLFMAVRYVKASGGCSAPPGKDAVAAQASIGQMRLRVLPGEAAQRSTLAQLMISHPNDSGMVMDQATRQYTPPHFVRKVDVTYNGRLVLSADIDFAISENPHLRFYFVQQQGGGELRAEVVDTQDLHFERSFTVQPTL
jgi:sulfur-oxidizing protein SoxY